MAAEEEGGGGGDDDDDDGEPLSFAAPSSPFLLLAACSSSRGSRRAATRAARASISISEEEEEEEEEAEAEGTGASAAASPPPSPLTKRRGRGAEEEEKEPPPPPISRLLFSHLSPRSRAPLSRAAAAEISRARRKKRRAGCFRAMFFFISFFLSVCVCGRRRGRKREKKRKKTFPFLLHFLRFCSSPHLPSFQVSGFSLRRRASRSSFLFAPAAHERRLLFLPRSPVTSSRARFEGQKRQHFFPFDANDVDDDDRRRRQKKKTPFHDGHDHGRHLLRGTQRAPLVDQLDAQPRPDEDRAGEIEKKQRKKEEKRDASRSLASRSFHPSAHRSFSEKKNTSRSVLSAALAPLLFAASTRALRLPPSAQGKERQRCVLKGRKRHP